MRREQVRLSQSAVLLLLLVLPARGRPEEPPEIRYECEDGKWIEARYFQSPLSHVRLELSDGRKINLAQTLSASGARYVDIGETIEFWNKGNEAFLSEGEIGKETKSTFVDCKTK